MNKGMLNQKVSEFLVEVEQMNQSSWNWGITVAEVGKIQEKVVDGTDDMPYLSQIIKFKVSNDHTNSISFNFLLEFTIDDDDSQEFTIYYADDATDLEVSQNEINEPQDLWMYLFQQTALLFLS